MAAGWRQDAGRPPEKHFVMERFLAAAVAASLLLAACSDTRARGSGGDRGPGALAPSSPGAGSPGGGSPAPGSATGDAAPTPGAGGDPGTAGATAPPGVADFVKASVPDDLEWGPRCASHVPGASCLVPFEGVVGLYSSDSGIVLLLAYENGASTPATSRPLEVSEGVTRLCVDPGCPFGGASLPYVPGRNAQQVSFYAELRDAGGRVLARSFPSIYPIHPAG